MAHEHAHHLRRPGAGHPRRSWLARVLLALVLGLMWSSGVKTSESEAEATEEISEGGESDAHGGPQRRAVRRPAMSHDGPSGRVLAWPAAPRQLGRRGPAPEAPRWARPRAPPPRDGDDHDDMIG